MALVKSEHRYARIASTKVNRILPIIRGREVGDSLDLLKTLPNRAARMVEAVVQTAAANASRREPFREPQDESSCTWGRSSQQLQRSSTSQHFEPFD